MRIEPDRVAGALPPVTAGAGLPAASDMQATPVPDSVAVSQRTSELDRARRKAAAAPDVRGDLVAAVRRQLDAGTYAVDLKQLAATLLQSPER